MSGPYCPRDMFETRKGYQPQICLDPENCQEDHNEEDPSTGESHHYSCECGWCQYLGWLLKG